MGDADFGWLLFLEGLEHDNPTLMNQGLRFMTAAANRAAVTHRRKD